MRNRITRVTDLPDQPAPGVCLYCRSCGDEFSATRRDYFWMPPEKPFRCGHDGALLQLVQKRTFFVEAVR
jgi:hypothetical protein